MEKDVVITKFGFDTVRLYPSLDAIALTYNAPKIAVFRGLHFNRTIEIVTYEETNGSRYAANIGAIIDGDGVVHGYYKSHKSYPALIQKKNDRERFHLGDDYYRVTRYRVPRKD